MSLEEDLLRLAELDRRVIRAVVEGDTETLPSVLTDYLRDRKRLDARLLEAPVASVQSEEARAVLRKVAGGEGLPSDGVIARLPGASTSATPTERFDKNEIQQLGETLFYSWFSHHEYIDGLAELRPMVLRFDASEAVFRLVRQIKDCYAFQQYDAAYALCRTLIEASVRDICVRCQLFPNIDANVVLLEEHRWSDLRRKVASGAEEERLKNLYRDLSTLLHGRKSVSKGEARRAFHETLEVVEGLYRAHSL